MPITNIPVAALVVRDNHGHTDYYPIFDEWQADARAACDRVTFSDASNRTVSMMPWKLLETRHRSACLAFLFKHGREACEAFLYDVKTDLLRHPAD